MAKDENGGVAVISSAAMKTLNLNKNGEMDLNEIDSAIRKILH